MTTYRKGMQIDCPHCHQDSLVKVETEMDGWTKVCDYFACAMCGAKLEEEEEEELPKDDALTAEPDDGGKKDLLDFLGTDESAREELIVDDGNRRFCRDCSHLMEHPFKVYCLHHKKDVNPMDDCPDFQRMKP